jgi:hypothetical protein
MGLETHYNGKLYKDIKKDDYIYFLTQGKTLRDIATELRTTHSIIASKLREFDISWEDYKQYRSKKHSSRKDINYKLNDLTPDELFRRISNGETTGYIGKCYGVEAGVIKCRYQKYGIDYDFFLDKRKEFILQQRKVYREANSVFLSHRIQ